MLVEFTLGIGSSLLTDLIKHGGERFLDSTRLGAKLKEKLGLLDNATEEEFKKLLLETYVVYFSRYPNRQFQIFYKFFSSEDVSKCLFNYVFNFQPVNYYDLEQALQNKMGSDWILFRILERDSLTTQKVIEDFINCYSDSEKKSVGLGFLLTLREIRQSEQRIIEKTSAKMKETSDIVNSVVGDFTSRLATLEDELKRIGVNTKDVPSLHSLSMDAKQVEAAIHELQILLTVIMADTENLLMDAKDSDVSEEIYSVIEHLSASTRMLHYSILNVMGYTSIAGYRFRRIEIDNVIRDLVDLYRPLAQIKRIVLQVKLRPKHQFLELSWAIELAINNLLNNALQYSFPKTPGKSGLIVISGEQAGSFYKLAIKNFGVGIPLEDQDKIFDDGYRVQSTKHLYRVGVGRGLYVAKAIIMRHHGKINVSSEEQGNGFFTVFEILLPYKQPAQDKEIS